EITVKLLANGVSTGKTLTLTEGNDWHGVFENLDAVSGGKPIVYTVEEVSVPKYKTSISGNATDGYTITNTLKEPKPVSVPVEKVWQDKDDHYGYRPVEITVKLLANGVSTGKTLTLTEGNDWHGVFENLDAVSGGEAIVYTVEEVSVPEYMTSISGNATDGYTITNTLKEPKPVSVPVEKVWQDKDDHYGYRPTEITVKLLANGVSTGKTLTLTEGNNWRGVFENLDAVSGGKPIVYTVEEVSVPEYMTSISGNATDGYTITNTLNEPKPVSVPVEKVWQDKDDHYGYRPVEITVKLLANGVSTGKTLTLTEGNDWHGVFENLDAVSGGEAIVYTVEEVSVPEYKTNISGNATDGYTITNTVVPLSDPPRKQQKRMPYTGAGTIRCLFVLLATGGIILAGMRRKKETK
ncbi:MAG: Cna B-type domain-containing protein, partial [Eubacteriales bacterium]|nr:Cna B-type domain-containing protein [Eubacteriales bacterium]